MSRAMWFVVLAVVGVAAIVLVALLSNRGGESQADARESFCSSLSTLESSLSSLTGLSPTTASKSDYQAALDEVESDWDRLEDAASDLKDVTVGELDDAWDSFESAVDDVPDDASVGDALDAVASAGQSLAASVSATLSGPDCS